MDTTNLCHLLLGTGQLVVKEISVGSDEIRLAVESTTERAECSVCQEESTVVHSTYTRFPIDLAWAEWTIILHLRVKRFFCRNERCPKRTFAEQLPGLVSRYARRTDRAIERQRHIGVEVCARSAERLLRLIRIGVSDTTVNRLIRAIATESATLARVLGVDDWAKRKGQKYGTILVDLERGEIVDLLADRTAETLIEWLKKHPGIEIVIRDRPQTYADAIKKGASEAIQVADRWHLLKNLSDVVFKILQQEYGAIKKRLASEGDEGESDDGRKELSGRRWLSSWQHSRRPSSVEKSALRQPFALTIGAGHRRTLLIISTFIAKQSAAICECLLPRQGVTERAVSWTLSSPIS